MSKRKTTSTAKRQSAKFGILWSFPLGKMNFIYFAVAIGVLILGYVLMATGITSDPQKHLETWANPVAIVVAPTVLVIAYCVIIPLAIMKRTVNSSAE